MFQLREYTGAVLPLRMVTDTKARSTASILAWQFDKASHGSFMGAMPVGFEQELRARSTFIIRAAKRKRADLSNWLLICSGLFGSHPARLGSFDSGRNNLQNLELMSRPRSNR